ncbi:MAG TPA: isocitrate lyase/phosphoenolpyruvate mutase family protein [Methylomirabilota bacterium]|jgi:2-methylisocitrate lyase-like PEP mutase family enzyme|nr:isocitrate lyase/phosphoenolpyruvate mutase family protein [Methylomirabilota bacterium]
MTLALKSKADAFRNMHQAPPMLILPNAWDVVTARLFVKAGARAIATTSAGIAATLGYADGQNVPRELMLEAIARIANAVDVPVTADIESGYADSPKELGESIRAVINAGAIGVNLEDATGDASQPLFTMEQQIERIRAAHKAAENANVPVVINARTDVYLAKVGEPAGRFAETVRRLTAYREAGADCLFVPGVTDMATLTQLVQSVVGPINVLAGSGMPPVADLQRIGIARLSVGSGIMRATLALARDAADELLQKGTYNTFLDRNISYSEVNELMK